MPNEQLIQNKINSSEILSNNNLKTLDERIAQVKFSESLTNIFEVQFRSLNTTMASSVESRAESAELQQAIATETDLEKRAQLEKQATFSGIKNIVKNTFQNLTSGNWVMGFAERLANVKVGDSNLQEFTTDKLDLNTPQAYGEMVKLITGEINQKNPFSIQDTPKMLSNFIAYVKGFERRTKAEQNMMKQLFSVADLSQLVGDTERLNKLCSAVLDQQIKPVLDVANLTTTMHKKQAESFIQNLKQSLSRGVVATDMRGSGLDMLATSAVRIGLPPLNILTGLSNWVIARKSVFEGRNNPLRVKNEYDKFEANIVLELDEVSTLVSSGDNTTLQQKYPDYYKAIFQGTNPSLKEVVSGWVQMSPAQKQVAVKEIGVSNLLADFDNRAQNDKAMLEERKKGVNYLRHLVGRMFGQQVSDKQTAEGINDLNSVFKAIQAKQQEIEALKAENPELHNTQINETITNLYASLGKSSELGRQVKAELNNEGENGWKGFKSKLGLVNKDELKMFGLSLGGQMLSTEVLGAGRSVLVGGASGLAEGMTSGDFGGVIKNPTLAISNMYGNSNGEVSLGSALEKTAVRNLSAGIDGSSIASLQKALITADNNIFGGGLNINATLNEMGLVQTGVVNEMNIRMPDGKNARVMTGSLHNTELLNKAKTEGLNVYTAPNGNVDMVIVSDRSDMSSVEFNSILSKLSNSSDVVNAKGLQSNVSDNQITFSGLKSTLVESNGKSYYASTIDGQQVYEGTSGDTDLVLNSDGTKTLVMKTATGNGTVRSQILSEQVVSGFKKVDVNAAINLAGVLEKSYATKGEEAVTSDSNSDRESRIQERLAAQNAMLRSRATTVNNERVTTTATRVRESNPDLAESISRRRTSTPVEAISNSRRVTSSTEVTPTRRRVETSRPTTTERPTNRRLNTQSETPRSRTRPVESNQNNNRRIQTSEIQRPRSTRVEGSPKTLSQLRAYRDRTTTPVQINPAPRFDTPTTQAEQNKQNIPAPKFTAPTVSESTSRNNSQKVETSQRVQTQSRIETPKTPTTTVEEFGKPETRTPIIEFGEKLPTQVSTRHGRIESNEVNQRNVIPATNNRTNNVEVPTQQSTANIRTQNGIVYNSKGEVVVPTKENTSINRTPNSVFVPTTIRNNPVNEVVVPTTEGRAENLNQTTVKNGIVYNSKGEVVVQTEKTTIPQSVVVATERTPPVKYDSKAPLTDRLRQFRDARVQTNKIVQNAQHNNQAVTRSNETIIPDAISNPLLAYDAKSNRLFNQAGGKRAEMTGKLIGELDKLEKTSYITYKQVAEMAAKGKALPENLRGIKLPKGLTTDALYDTLKTDPNLAKKIADNSISVLAVGSVEVENKSKTSALVLPLPGLILGSAEGEETSRLLVIGKSAIATNDNGYDIVSNQNYNPNIPKQTFKPEVIKQNGKIIVTYPGNTIKLENSGEEYNLVTNSGNYKITDPKIIQQIKNGQVVPQRVVLDYLAKSDPQNSLVKNVIDLSKAAPDLNIKDVNGKTQDLGDLLARNSKLFYSTKAVDGSDLQNSAVSKDVVNKEDAGMALYLLSSKSNLTSEQKAAFLAKIQNSGNVGQRLLRGNVSSDERYYYGVRKFLEATNSPLLTSKKIYEPDVLEAMSQTNFNSVRPVLEASKESLVDTYKAVTKKYDRYLVGSGRRILNPENSTPAELTQALNNIQTHLSRNYGVSANDIVALKKENGGDYNTRVAEIATLQSLLGQKAELVSEKKTEKISLGLNGLTGSTNYNYGYKNENVVTDVDTRTIQTSLENNPELKKVTNSITFVGPIPIPGLYLDPLKTKIATGLLSKVLPAGGIYSQRQTSTSSELNFTPQQLENVKVYTEATINILTNKEIRENTNRLIAGTGNNGMTHREALLAAIPTSEVNGTFYVNLPKGKPIAFKSAAERNAFLDNTFKAGQSLVVMEADQLNGKGRTRTNLDLLRNPEFNEITQTFRSTTATKNEFEQMVSNSNVKNANILAKRFADSFAAVDANKKIDLPKGQKQVLTPSQFAAQIGHYPAGAGVFGDGRGNLKTEYFVGTRSDDKIIISQADLAKAKAGNLDYMWAKIERCNNLLRIPLYKPEEFTISQGAEFNRTGSNTLQEDIHATQTTEKNEWNLAAFLKLPKPKPEQPRNDQPEQPKTPETPKPEPKKVEIGEGQPTTETGVPGKPAGDFVPDKVVTPIENPIPQVTPQTPPASMPNGVEIPTPGNVIRPPVAEFVPNQGAPVVPPSSTSVYQGTPSSFGNGIGNTLNPPSVTPVNPFVPPVNVTPVVPPTPTFDPTKLDFTSGLGGMEKLPPNGF